MHEMAKDKVALDLKAANIKKNNSSSRGEDETLEDVKKEIKRLEDQSISVEKSLDF